MDLYRLIDGRLVPGEDPGPPAVVDSWLVNEGTTRALDLHRARFGASCRIRGVPAPQLDLFWAQALGRLPMTGSWFPRAELSAAGQLYLRLRPSPPLGTGVTVRPHPDPDPRTDPRTKGPDIALLAEIRAQAAAHGADEALLLSAEGFVLEGTTTSLLWWDGDSLCLPGADLPVLQGVTSQVIVRLAEDAGIPVRHRRALLADLDGRESWMVNALHGLRPVTGWAGAPLRAASPARALGWARRLRRELGGGTLGGRATPRTSWRPGSRG
jgi:branched-subunit amino acid aminotransferase/4-amino-4-deoxychorismate lyase